MTNEIPYVVRAVTEVTRRAIIHELALAQIPWSGNLDEPAFLNRLYRLRDLPSSDRRFADAADDIWQHRVNNQDGDNDWVFFDSRFDLLNGSDEVFLRFLAEMVHPVVRRDPNEVLKLVELLNRHLTVDGWELVERMRISARPVFVARRLLNGASLPIDSAHLVSRALDADYVTRQIARLESAIGTDPELAIGTAKEFVETVCKTILKERSQPYDQGLEFPKLVRAALRTLKLLPEEMPDQAKSSETIRNLLNRLAALSQDLAEFRNRFGTGHGKHASTKSPSSRHARLAVGAAITFAVFLFETHQEQALPP